MRDKIPIIKRYEKSNHEEKIKILNKLDLLIASEKGSLKQYYISLKNTLQDEF